MVIKDAVIFYLVSQQSRVVVGKLYDPL